MAHQYLTLANAAREVPYREKGSRFLGFALPVRSIEEAKEELLKVRTLHPKATHHCFAYRIGPLGATYRASDDGEPSSTAGIPIYNQILSRELTNVLVVVVRYYGGVKLGVSGLIKAYRESAQLALDEAGTELKDITYVLSLRFPYHLQNQVFALLSRKGAHIESFEAMESCTVLAHVPSLQKESICESFSQMHEVTFCVLD